MGLRGDVIFFHVLKRFRLGFGMPRITEPRDGRRFSTKPLQGGRDRTDRARSVAPDADRDTSNASFVSSERLQPNVAMASTEHSVLNTPLPSFRDIWTLGLCACRLGTRRLVLQEALG